MKVFAITIFLLQFGLSHGQDNRIECLDSPNRLDLFQRHIKDTVSVGINQESGFLKDTIYMKVNLDAEVQYDYLIKGIQIEIINTMENDFVFFDGVLNLVCQARNEKGEWVDIELWGRPWDYNGVPNITLKSKSLLKAISPCYQGTLNTILRYRFQSGKATFYSNEFPGRINPGQLGK